jgi:hypothetical protein
MMEEVEEIIRRQEAQRDRLPGTDPARRFQPRSRQMSYHVSKIAVISAPQGDEKNPVSVLNGLHAYVAGLIVAWEIQRFLEACADKSLVVIGR